MAPPKRHGSRTTGGNKWLEWLIDLATNPSKLWIAALLLLPAELLVCILIIWKVPYTEIDWSTYMQQVECFLNGTLDYSNISGDTGPIVYPAGHLYLYTLLHRVTDHGTAIRLGQYIFAGLYVTTLLLVFRIYQKSRVIPPYALFFVCCTSYRIHSIFVLRLFNDPLAMLLFFVAVNLWLSKQWTIGCIFYSLAVSVKMNVLLFAPALFFILLIAEGPTKAFFNIAICGIVQLVIGGPFLLSHPIQYISRSFNLGRVFLYEWTVNWRLLPEDIFLDRRLHLALLAAHLVVLALFAYFKWFKSHGGIVQATVSAVTTKKSKRAAQSRSLSPNDILFPLFTANFIGMMFSRSLHYQFYSWYFHSLPYLLWSSKLHPIINMVVMIGIELCWNTYPSTVISSAALHLLHIVIAVGLIGSQRNDPTDATKAKRS
uniref:dolichyl-P-Man:Man5GlcNAc2-PP-dolichol alpha-1,3-mannosyltransferase n=1 Tax=Plectus sambesii TaxID=2011161 RepID=A0A914VP06_9BILA